MNFFIYSLSPLGPVCPWAPLIPLRPDRPGEPGGPWRPERGRSPTGDFTKRVREMSSRELFVTQYTHIKLRRHLPKTLFANSPVRVSSSQVMYVAIPHIAHDYSLFHLFSSGPTLRRAGSVILPSILILVL